MGLSGRSIVETWLDALGYKENPGSLFLARDVQRIPREHAYAQEARKILSQDDIGADAVFDVEGTPTVCFVDVDKLGNPRDGQLNLIRQRLWNQNLVSVLFVLEKDRLDPHPIGRTREGAPPLLLSEASRNGRWSAAEFQSGDVQERLPQWFRIDDRVDRHLLENLKLCVKKLAPRRGPEEAGAQTLMGQVLFISYLEHRKIIGDEYRNTRMVGSLPDLIKAGDRAGLARLYARLKKDFNGDLLAAVGQEPFSWSRIADHALGVVGDFLSRVDLATGQGHLWNYDFSYIPVEMISGIYETFLGDSKTELGAYYTPRHLANLAVEQAFDGMGGADEQTVLDGACGSGILLTTAFRRMLAAAEARGERRFSLQERVRLLKNRIFGGDINETACRVTAFSLYLSLLEDLDPCDIAKLQQDQNVTLPPLIGTNIMAGEKKGDFFAPGKTLDGRRRVTIYISNPPWREPGAGEKTSYDAWNGSLPHPHFLPQRQIAAAFAHKCLEHVEDGGRACLILPLKLFAAPTSARFVREWLLAARVKRIINFSDMRRLLFPKAVHPCVVVTVVPRRGKAAGVIPPGETVEYWTPKTDISLALGRLSLHPCDRTELHTHELLRDNARIRMRYWGSYRDVDLVSRLMRGHRIKDFTSRVHGKKAWTIRKGFHVSDRHVKPKPSAPLRRFKFLPAHNLQTTYPVIPASSLIPFPADEIPTVANFGDKEIFTGPRILFPDGVSKEFEIRAAFSTKDFCFMSSVGVISGPEEDRLLLQFLAVYLRSTLAKYLLLMTCYSLSGERPRISLQEVKSLPLIAPEKHGNPERARRILSEVDSLFSKMHGAVSVQDAWNDDTRAHVDDLVMEYFGLGKDEKVLAEDFVEYVAPSVQPSGYRAIRTPLLVRPPRRAMEEYVATLTEELAKWQRSLGGKGSARVSLVASDIDDGKKTYRAGPLGTVRISLEEKPAEKSGITYSDDAVSKVLAEIRRHEILPPRITENFFGVPDIAFFAGKQIYIVKPLARRFWMRSSALADTYRLVLYIQGRSGSA